MFIQGLDADAAILADLTFLDAAIFVMLVYEGGLSE